LHDNSFHLQTLVSNSTNRSGSYKHLEGDVLAEAYQILNPSSSSCGGRRGIYFSCDGDFPVGALHGARAPQNLPRAFKDTEIQHEDFLESADAMRERCQLRIFHLNVRGLRSDDRLQELLLELALLDLQDGWDVVMLNETWRGEACEFIEIDGGHVFFGAGYVKCERGVAIILHKRWKSRVLRTTVVSERLAFIDMAGGGIRVRFVSAYFPHSGYTDMHVQELYTALTEIRKEAKTLKLKFILAGDFNAEVGSRSDHDDFRVLGPHGLNLENCRGQWLKQWATLEDLVFANTFFSKPPAGRITHVGPSGRARQIDYILVDRRLWPQVRDSGSVPHLSMGSDHTCVHLRIDVKCIAHKSSSTRRRMPHASWKHVDETKFRRELSTTLPLKAVSGNIDDQLEQIENSIVQAARLASSSSCPGGSEQDPQIRRMIEHRRSLPPASNATERTQLSKAIQRAIRKARRKQTTSAIDRILKNFRGIKHIKDIKSLSRKKFITHMTNTSGAAVADRQEIANVFADFYEDLYASKVEVAPDIPQNQHDGRHDEEIPFFRRKKCDMQFVN
jgi:exonuclease III